MSRIPVRVDTAGAGKGTHVHALINTSRIGCYIPFLTSTPVSAVEVMEQKLSLCRYCWPNGVVVWPATEAGGSA